MKWKLLLLCTSFIAALDQSIQVSAIQCEVWNATYQGDIFVECTTTCWAAWFNASGILRVEHKGCWQDNAVSHVNDNCEGWTQLRDSPGPFITMCYCKTDFCNVNLKWVGNKTVRHQTVGDTSKPITRKDYTLLYVLVPILIIAVGLIVFFIIFIRNRSKSQSLLDNISKGSEVETLIPTKQLPPIDLKDVLSQGQFCCVRKGRMGCKDVAVKIFPITQFSKPTPSALTEKDIYTACQLSHENILKFIGEHHYEEGNQQQLWLVTEYIERGSLSDFLKGNTITWDNLFHMSEGMALGMAYLHVEIPRVKPSIAHRDIKSKNILVKNDLTCCISDFGLSLKFDDKDGPGDTHGQVGTRRYMAPEVLEGAINFSREAFLRIDMYAFALCLWELLTRCTDVQEEPVGDYKLPFEEEVGVHPSLEDLQDFVVNKKMRPKFSPEWKNNDQAIDGMIETIEECWDHDADARLTADCVAERIKGLCATARRQLNTPVTVSFKPLKNEDATMA